MRGRSKGIRLRWRGPTLVEYFRIWLAMASFAKGYLANSSFCQMQWAMNDRGKCCSIGQTGAYAGGEGMSVTDSQAQEQAIDTAPASL